MRRRETGAWPPVRAAAVLIVVTVLLGGCGEGDDSRSTVPYSQWTECPSQPRFSERRWGTVDGVNEEMNEYAWRHHCTFSFVGARPARVVELHNNPDSD